MSYSPKVAGLLTEVAAQNAGQETLLDCQDVVISQDSKIESRHGINSQTLTRSATSWTASDFEATGFSTGNQKSNLSIFKVKFDSPVSSRNFKYVILNGNTSSLVELVTTSNLTDPILGYSNTFNVGYSAKPIVFTFDQSFYVVGPSGWVESKKDVLFTDSTISRRLQWPPFTDINIETFQDTLDFSTNWFSIDSKVGIRFSYVLNTRYNDDTPREVESSPSPIYEVLHPMAIRTQAVGSNIASTTKDKSRIRVRVGESFRNTTSPFYIYGSDQSNDRKFYLRIYRTKQVPIAEALPTEYFQAFPDIYLGANNVIPLTGINFNAGTDRLNIIDNLGNFNNGDYVYLSITGTGSSFSGFYYLGNQSGDQFLLYTNSLYTSPADIPVGITSATLIKVYEANLTVNDDAIQGLTQLYTNPNVDGEANRNSVPPIANSVVEYKNYHVAANIREPLRAYITMVSQPLVKNLQFTQTLTNATNQTAPSTGTTYTFNTFNLDTSVPGDLIGITGGSAFSIDSVFFKQLPVATITNVSGITLTASKPSDLQISGTRVGNEVLKFDGNLVQANANMIFRFNGTTSITAQVLPEYNRSSPYKRYDDKNLEYLQFSGPLQQYTGAVSPTDLRYYPYSIRQPSLSLGHRSILVYHLLQAGSGKGQTTPLITTSNPTLTLAATTGTDAVLANSNYYEVPATKIDINGFAEPGIAAISPEFGGTTYFFSYKLVRNTDSSTVRFYGVTNLSSPPLPTGPSGGANYFFYFIDASNIANAPLYFSFEPFSSNVTGLAGDSSLQASPIPLKSYYDKPIAIVDSSILAGEGFTAPLFLGTLARSPAQLLDLSVTKLVQRLNDQVAATALSGFVTFAKTDNVGEFYVEYIGGNKIEAYTSGQYHKYEPQISNTVSTYTTLAEYSKNNVRAVSISRNNAPESFPDSSVLAPFLVGSDKAQIVALAKNSNDCFILKEDGIWRMSISGNSSVAQVDEITQLDTTTYCQAPYSVQEINEEIIFLSQKGFISISGNSISAIGRNIETEVKSKLQVALSNNFGSEIRSWVNEEKRIYGCCIRESNLVYTTYIFNTYTREWTKFNLPIVDASTDDQGKTLFFVPILVKTLGAGATLQAQMDAATTTDVFYGYLTEELHTGGQNRNELDQYDYKYTPVVVALGTGTQVVLTDNSDTFKDEFRKLGGTGATLGRSGLNQFIGRKAYYRKAGVFYPCTFVSRTANTCTIEFTTVPPSITSIAAGDGLYAGVPASVTFNPSSVGTPDTNKQFAEYMIHVDEAVSGLKMKFKTDSQANFTATREFAFDSSAPNRSVYRTYIPVSASRGRWFIRQVSHEVPMERLVMTAQTINIRETSSSRVQKQQ